MHFMYMTLVVFATVLPGSPLLVFPHEEGLHGYYAIAKGALSREWGLPLCYLRLLHDAHWVS